MSLKNQRYQNKSFELQLRLFNHTQNMCSWGQELTSMLKDNQFFSDVKPRKAANPIWTLTGNS